MFLELTAITVDAERQRKDFGDIASLAESFRKIGQISPIVVEPMEDGNWRLIAGERRLKAAKAVGWFKIECVEKKDLDDRMRQLIELEENVRRKQLEWPEEILAIHAYVRAAKEPGHVSAKALGFSPESLSQRLTLAEALLSNPKLRLAPTWTSAHTQHQIQAKRAADAAIEEFLAEDEPDEISALLAAAEPSVQPVAQPSAPAPANIRPLAEFNLFGDLAPAPAPARLPSAFSASQSSFLDWAPAYAGTRFNLIHCDFPYGLNMGTANLQNSSARWDVTDGRYEDSPELFDSLCRAFFDNQDRFVAGSAHCIFWLAHRNYGKIAARFRHYGWEVCETPLIWHKTDNAGIAPDVRRWPRRTYEMAVFASRGDRKILKVKAASYGGPTTKEHHLSEKPLAMLEHFFEMLVDEHTEILDPTAGSGTALAVAKKLGAKRGLGLDVLSEHVQYINKNVGD